MKILEKISAAIFVISAVVTAMEITKYYSHLVN
jgi:hypothetical protein